jgi:hypothetical protein
MPVVRSPLWQRPAADDNIPGSPGMAFLDATQSALQVAWSRARGEQPFYYPDSLGLYPLCHGLQALTPLTVFTAKEGVQVRRRRLVPLPPLPPSPAPLHAAPSLLA